jgi:hypothetical protein
MHMDASDFSAVEQCVPPFDALHVRWDRER